MSWTVLATKEVDDKELPKFRPFTLGDPRQLGRCEAKGRYPVRRGKIIPTVDEKAGRGLGLLHEGPEVVVSEKLCRFRFPFLMKTMAKSETRSNVVLNGLRVILQQSKKLRSRCLGCRFGFRCVFVRLLPKFLGAEVTRLFAGFIGRH